MASLVSPGIQVVEKDFSSVVPNVSTGVGAIAGRFTKGPIDTPILIESEKRLAEIFGPPSENNYLEWFTAAQFLQYTDKLWAVRARAEGALNSYVAGGNGVPENTMSFGNKGEYDVAIYNNTIDADVHFIAKNLTSNSNNIGVLMIDNANWGLFKTWANSLAGLNEKFEVINGVTPEMATSFAAQVKYQPNTTENVKKYAGDNKYDECHFIVYDQTGKITGTKYGILEMFTGLSKAIDAIDNAGNSIYYPNYINTQSNYIWMPAQYLPTLAADGVQVFQTGSYINSVIPQGTTFASFDLNYGTGAGTGIVAGVTIPSAAAPSRGGVVTVSNGKFSALMGNGVEGTYASYSSAAVTESQLATAESNVLDGYKLFANTDSYNVGFFLSAGYRSIDLLNNLLTNVAYVRRDSIVFYSPLKVTASGEGDSVTYKFELVTDQSKTATTDIIDWKNRLNISETYASYAVCDSGYKYIYDKYNNKYRYVPMNGDIAGLCAQTEKLADAWWSPAGFNRGGLKNVIKLPFNPTQAQRDILYPASINPVVAFPGQGVVLYGDKTMTLKASAFDHINVRRLFIILEKAISTAAKYQLFEFNDSFTRAQFKNMVEPYLRSIQGRRGIIDFLVVCDETNNTGNVIDNNEFVADIMIKPTRSINYITLSFVATRTDVSFSTLVGA